MTKKKVVEITITVALEDGRRSQMVFLRSEKIAEILCSEDLGPTIRSMVDQIPEKAGT